MTALLEAVSGDAEKTGPAKSNAKTEKKIISLFLFVIRFSAFISRFFGKHIRFYHTGGIDDPSPSYHIFGVADGNVLDIDDSGQSGNLVEEIDHIVEAAVDIYPYRYLFVEFIRNRRRLGAVFLLIARLLFGPLVRWFQIGPDLCALVRRLFRWFFRWFRFKEQKIDVRFSPRHGNGLKESGNFPLIGKFRQGTDGEIAWSVRPMEGPKLKEGDIVTAVIINVDRKNRGINLSIKALTKSEDNAAMQKLSAESNASAGTTNLGALLKAKMGGTKPEA